MNSLQNILTQIDKQNTDIQNINTVLDRSEKINQLHAIRKITMDLLSQSEAMGKTDSSANAIDVLVTIIKKCMLLMLKVDWTINEIDKDMGGRNYSRLKDYITSTHYSNFELYEFFKEMGIGPDNEWFIDKNNQYHKHTHLALLFKRYRECSINKFFNKYKLIYEGKAELNQKLVSLSKEILANKDEAKIKELKTVMTSWKLSTIDLVKFLEKEISDPQKVIDFIDWDHGDLMGAREAEDLLTKTAAGTWILRKCPNTNIDKITKKYDSDYAHLYLTWSKEDLLKGVSRNDKLWDMFVNEKLLHTHPYLYGKFSNQEAEQKLKGTPIGSWLFHFSDNDQQFAFSIQMGNETYKHILIEKDKCQQTSLRMLFEYANKIVKAANDVGMRQNIAGISAEFLDPKQAEQKVTDLFKTMLQKDKTTATEFKNYGFAKLSRRKFGSLPTSFLIEDKGNQAIKIHQMIHGPGAFLGKGVWKIAKVMQNLDGSQGNLVVSRYYRENQPSGPQTMGEVEKEFPELRQILVILSKMGYIAQERLVSLGNKAFMISDYAKMTLDKLIKKGFTDDQKKKYALHLLTGLTTLHKEHIAHRDIKSDNVKIIENTVTHEDEACHADLDSVTERDNPGKPKGTPAYQAPEILKRLYGSLKDLQKGDVYAMGMVLYEIYYGQHLWYDDSIGDAGTNLDFFKELYFMTNDQILEKYPKPPKDTVEHLIWQMLHPNSKLRPIAQEALDQFITLAYPEQKNKVVL